MKNKANSNKKTAAVVDTTIYPRTLADVKLNDIVIGKQPRIFFDEDELSTLTADIKQMGVLQPIGINMVGGVPHLIYGERRVRGSKSIMQEDKTRDSIPAVIYNDLPKEVIVAMQIKENLHQKDIHPMEEAASFINYMTESGYDVKELAARVNKSITYVGLRLKLNDLIPELQEAFYKNKMNLTTANEFAKLSPASQQEIWKSEGEKERIDVKNLNMKRFMLDLVTAPFDKDNATLVEGVGACSSCPFNTAFNTLLFPEEASKAICTNSPCFKNKCNTSYNLKLAEVLNDTETLLLSDDWDKGNKADELTEKGHTVYTRRDIRVIEEPEMPVKADFAEENNYMYETQEEMEEGFADAMKEYEEEKEEYSKMVASGKLKKAFVVEGRKEGQFLYVSLEKRSGSGAAESKPTAKGLSEKIKENKATEADINAELTRLKDAEKRKCELDEEKTQPLIYDVLKKEKTTSIASQQPLNKNEKIVMLFVLENIGGYQATQELNKMLGRGNQFEVACKKTEKELDKLIAGLTRAIMLDKTRPSQGDRPSKSPLAASMRLLAETYNKKAVDTIWSAQMKERAKREERVKARVADLNTLKKELKPKAKAPVKAATKKAA